MAAKPGKRTILQRLFGIAATRRPQDEGCWEYADGKATVDLRRAPELAASGGALRLEGKGMPKRVLVVRGEDGAYQAFCNKCTHMGRRLDPYDADMLQCCSISKTTYGYDGRVISGPGRSEIIPFDVATEEDRLIITLR